ncbi:MAG: YcxB family protein [Clostridium sp.]
MFETTGIYNEKLIKETAKHKYNRSQVWTSVTLCIIFLGVDVVSILLGYSQLGYIFFSGSILIVIADYIATKLRVSRSVKLLEEIYGSCEVEYRTEFNEEGIVVYNLNANSSNSIGYSSFKKIIESSDVFVILTKAEQCLFVFKGCLSVDEIIEFKKFIREKCPSIRGKFH